MDLNRIRMMDKNGKKKEYDMAAEDKLWSSYKGSPFPLVAEAIQSDLDSYRKNEEEIKRLKASMVNVSNVFVLGFKKWTKNCLKILYVTIGQLLKYIFLNLILGTR